MYRINRCIPGYSRRQVDQLVAEGRVQINKRVAALGDKLDSADQLSLDGQPIHQWHSYISRITTTKESTTDKSQAAQPLFYPDDGFLYLKLHKPVDSICTTSNKDPRNFLQTMGLTRTFPTQRLFPVGRLDKNTTGLLLVTSNPRFQYELLDKRKNSPADNKENTGENESTESIASKYEKIYEVTLDQQPSADMVHAWRTGVKITFPTTSGKFVTSTTRPCQVNVLHLQDDEKKATGKHQIASEFMDLIVSKNAQQEVQSTVLEFVLREGRNRQLHRMVNLFGIDILSIHRTSFCGIGLEGIEKAGQWKHLSKNELQFVNDIVK